MNQHAGWFVLQDDYRGFRQFNLQFFAKTLAVFNEAELQCGMQHHRPIVIT
jgi:hypothetical protein